MASAHPHVAWRDGRPRFQPGAHLRAAGYKGTDLRWPLDAPTAWKIADLKPGDTNAGRWFSKGEAVDWSAAFVRSLAKERKRGTQVKAKPAAAPKRANTYSVGQLFEDWFRSQKFQMPADQAERRRLRAAKIIYADNSVSDFRAKARAIENHDPSLWAAPVDSLSQPVMLGLYEELATARGLAMGRGAMAVFSMALSWGKRRGKFTFRENAGINPAQDLGMATPPPRVRFATRTEIETLVSIADRMSWPELGDMVLLGVWTGQRQADRLELVDQGLFNRRRIFRQAKTGAIVAVLESPELERRLAASAERRRVPKAAELLAAPAGEREAIERRWRRVILDEQPDRGVHPVQWKPMQRFRYSDRFGLLRSYAVAGVIDAQATAAAGRAVWTVPPCPSLADFRDQDLRDTAVVWMALAGATIPEIISVTGHTPTSAHTILKHYLAQHPEMADAAIGKMIAWFDAGGETEIGL
jgi:hypothetical protein